jgi:hypothetical protein
MTRVGRSQIIHLLSAHSTSNFRLTMRRNLCFPLVCGAALFGLFFTADASKIKHPHVTLDDSLLGMCNKRSPISKARQKKELKWLVEASGRNSLLITSSAQHQAACWMLQSDRKQSKGRSRDLYLQRYALAVLFVGTTKSNTTAWDWRMAVDEPKAEAVQGHWMSTRHHECSWYGVSCQYWTKQVERLIVGYMKLDGILPREMYLLPRLKELDLHGNDFQGILPLKMVSSLGNLEYLRLHMNGFFGALNDEIAGLRSLKELHLFGNYFSGTLPASEIASLSNLEVIDMYANFLTGTIPSALGKLKKLRVLDLHDNNLVGKVPKEICDLNVSSFSFYRSC